MLHAVRLIEQVGAAQVGAMVLDLVVDVVNIFHIGQQKQVTVACRSTLGSVRTVRARSLVHNGVQ